jgi:hypothetical protein
MRKAHDDLQESHSHISFTNTASPASSAFSSSSPATWQTGETPQGKAHTGVWQVRLLPWCADLANFCILHSLTGFIRVHLMEYLTVMFPEFPQVDVGWCGSRYRTFHHRLELLPTISLLAWYVYYVLLNLRCWPLLLLIFLYKITRITNLT